MKKCLYSSLLLLLAVSFSSVINAEALVEYGDNYIVFEADATDSDLGMWVLRQPGDEAYYDGGSLLPIGDDYLEFTGNDMNGGSAMSPLTYTFTCPKTANYRLVMRMYQALAEGEADDKRNDVWIRLEGDYESACRYPKDQLETDHKFWGRGVRKWGSCHALEGHVDGVKYLEKVVYSLTKGETYTFTISGRAQGCSLDYILLYEESLNLTADIHVDIAASNSDIYRPGLGLVEPTDIMLASTLDIRTQTSITLSPSFAPENAIKDVVWSSSNENIIDVDENGKITAVGTVGQSATIVVSSTVNDKQDSCVVSIVDWYAVGVDSILLDLKDDELVEGGSYDLMATVYPSYADDVSLTWESSDTSIAKVDEEGTVTANGYGEVTIWAISNADTTTKKDITLDIEALVLPSVSFDDENKYLTTTYYSGDSIELTFNFEAGNYATVNEGVKVWLREIKSGWNGVASDPYNIVLTELGGLKSGTKTVKVPLDGITPTANLTEGYFYFLFLTFTNSKSVSVDKGIFPIIIEADPSAISESEKKKLLVYPNPVSGGVATVKGLDKVSEVAVYSLAGTQVLLSTIDSQGQLDVSSLDKGIYMLVVDGTNTEVLILQ